MVQRFQLNTIQRITETDVSDWGLPARYEFQLNTIQRITETLRKRRGYERKGKFQLNTIQRITETGMCQKLTPNRQKVSIKHYPTNN